MPASDFNPHAPEYTRLESRLAALGVELEYLEVELEWMGERTPDSVRGEVELAEANVTSAHDFLSSAKSNVLAKLATRVACRERGFEQRHIAEQELEKAKATVALAESGIPRAEVWLKKIQEDLLRFQAYDLSEATVRKDLLLQQIRTAQQDLDALRPEYDRVQAAMGPLALRLDALERRKSQLLEKLSRAKLLEDELNCSGPRGRHLAHSESEELFGDPRPSRVAHKASNELSEVERALTKLRRRIEGLVRRTTREISVLVVDGNNLCYQGRQFCGLSPLKAALPLLVQACDVRVIFDSTIRSRLRQSDQAIAAELGGLAKLHIVASKQKADETLLDLADASGAYVLSNDRFAEFPDKGAVREQRLIRHEIVAGRVLIHDLNVDIPFSVDA